MMVRLIFIDHSGNRQAVDAQPGETVMEAAVRQRVNGIEASCGGSMACGTCHSYISEPWYSKINPPSPDEAAMLDYGVHIEATSRLTCQVQIVDELEGAEIRTPVEQV
jgi:2Fe-2S ferredoxin